MQPSMTQARALAAWAMRTASRISPDLASLMLIPCAISAQPATSLSRWHLVHEDRQRRAHQQLAAARVARGRSEGRGRRRRAPRVAAAPRLPRPRTTIRSRQPEAAAPDAPYGPDALHVQPVRRRASASAAEPARRLLGPAAMSSGSPSQTVHEVGGPGAGARAPAPAARRAAPAGHTAPRRAPLSRRARPPAASPRSPPARTDARQWRARFDVGERRGGRLAVALDRRRLAEAGDVMPELDLDDVGLVARLAGDHERLGEP